MRKDFRWVPTSGGNIPPDAVAAGRTSSGETLYVGRAHHDGALVVGKVKNSTVSVTLFIYLFIYRYIRHMELFTYLSRRKNMDTAITKFWFIIDYVVI